MLKKILLLIILFGLGFVFGLKADKFGFNSLGVKKGLDSEIASMKQSIVLFGESFSDGFFSVIFGNVIIFVGTYAEWLFLLYVIIVVIRMIIVYLR